ncbi:MAG: NAD(P)H-hydrate dehydratase [Acidobacteria bacterium]|nr:NAD(P)H-hydrate dehydratase [Acidobacteriota bacterium]
MREADRQTIEELGIPSMVLMENAGRQVVAAMEAAFAELADARVAVLCGHGNNGGDGFVVARVLWQRGTDVQVYLVGAVAGVAGDARANLEILGRLGLSAIEIGSDQDWDLHGTEVLRSDIVVDALFGTGLRTPMTGLRETIADDLNASGVPVVAVDLPSGLSADAAFPIGPAINATLTVTLAAPKMPLMLPPAEEICGSVMVADIGIPRMVIDRIPGPRVERLTHEELRRLVRDRDPGAHKGSFGHALIVAGSRGKTGAAHLAAEAALRSGAGLVTVATPASCVAIVAALGACYMTEPLEETVEGAVAARAADCVLAGAQGVIAVGPGLGTAPDQRAFVRALLQRATVPLVLDADALTVLADDTGVLKGTPERPVVVTPHPGEMARLLGTTAADVQQRRLDVARDFARAHGVYVVLKGQRTLVATPEGVVFINPTGNPGMATGGSGDVLTGVVAGWLAQGLPPADACTLAVYLHGAAGDLAASDVGEVAMTAGDVLSQLGEAVLELTAREQREQPGA